MAKIRQEINFSGATYNSQCQMVVALDTRRYSGSVTYYFEVVARGGTVSSSYGLRAVGDGSDTVSLTFNGMTYGIQRTAFTPPANALTQYQIVHNNGDAQMRMTSGRIVVIQDIGSNALTKTQSQVEVGEVASSSYTTPQTQTSFKYWKYYSANWNGTVTAYFESSGRTPSSKSGLYIKLQRSPNNGADWYDLVTNTHTNTTAGRVRSASITLTDGDIYRTQYWGSTTKSTCYMYGAKIIIDQDDATAITKLEGHQLLCNYTVGDHEQPFFLTTFDPTEWPSGTNFYHEASLSLTNMETALVKNAANLQHDSLETSTEVYVGLYGGTGTNEVLAQSFVPAATFDLERVEARLKEFGTCTDYIYFDIATSLSGSAIATTGQYYAYDIYAGTGGTIAEFFFSSPVTVTQGTTYYLRFYRTGARSTINYIGWEKSTASLYSSGSAFIRNSGTWTDASSTDDHYFRTFHAHWAASSLGGTAGWNRTSALTGVPASSDTLDALLINDNGNSYGNRLVGAITISASADLTADDSTHSHSAETLGLTQSGSISIAAADHSHSAETVALLSSQILGISESAHAHSAETLEFTQATPLSIDSAGHSHTAETLPLSSTQILGASNSAHAHTAEEPALADVTEVAYSFTESREGFTPGTVTGGVTTAWDQAQGALEATLSTHSSSGTAIWEWIGPLAQLAGLSGDSLVDAVQLSNFEAGYDQEGATRIQVGSVQLIDSDETIYSLHSGFDWTSFTQQTGSAQGSGSEVVFDPAKSGEEIVTLRVNILLETGPSTYATGQIQAVTVKGRGKNGSKSLRIDAVNESQTTDTLALDQIHILAIAESAHAHSADTIGLTEEFNLSASDATHGHTADTQALIQLQSILAQNALHAHSAEEVGLSLSQNLEIADSAHAHVTDAVSANKYQNGVLDTFNRADGALGSNWSCVQPTYITDHRVYLDSLIGSSINCVWNANSFGLDQEAYFTFTDFNTTHIYTSISLVLKHRDINNFILAVYRKAQAHVDIYLVNGNYNNHYVHNGINFSVGDQFRALLLGSTLHVYKNDTELFEQDVSSFSGLSTTPTQIGFRYNIGAAGDYEGIDSFGGGTAIVLQIDQAAHGHTADTVSASQAFTIEIGDASHGHTAETPALIHINSLTSQDTSHAHTSDSLAAAQIQNLSVESVLSLHTVETPALDQGASLEIGDAIHAHTAEETALTQLHVLAGSEADHGQSAESPALTQGQALAVSDSTHLQIADSPAISATGNLLCADTEHALSGEVVALAQVRNLGISDSTHSQAAEEAALSQTHGLNVQPAFHSEYSSDPALLQSHTITVADASHLQSADALVLAATQYLVIQAGAHSHQADEAALLAVHSLPISETVHGQESESLSLTQVQVLAIADSSHSHSAEEVEFSPNIGLEIDGSAHAQSAEEASLSSSGSLSLSEAFHAQYAESLSLDQVHFLASEDTHHTHSTEEVFLTVIAVISLEIDDTAHVSISDEIALVDIYQMEIQDTGHAQPADAVRLGQIQNLYAQDTSHVQLAETLDLFGATSLSIDEGMLSHYADTIAIIDAGSIVYLVYDLDTYIGSEFSYSLNVQTNLDCQIEIQPDLIYQAEIRPSLNCQVEIQPDPSYAVEI